MLGFCCRTYDRLTADGHFQARRTVAEKFKGKNEPNWKLDDPKRLYEIGGYRWCVLPSHRTQAWRALVEIPPQSDLELSLVVMVGTQWRLPENL